MNNTLKIVVDLVQGQFEDNLSNIYQRQSKIFETISFRSFQFFGKLRKGNRRKVGKISKFFQLFELLIGKNCKNFDKVSKI